ncbi:MAG: heme lyase CcmF/NrfE family subunit [Spirochaetaceae bacterium]|nr:heme lyase CcmF/NrfE family subunit [Myxococcales bacterium]MCB9724518.1 heme lyase CcmF/NrfE family subunit [Spirochaetaceae bacterium]
MADLGMYALRLGFFLCLLGFGAGLAAGITKRDEWTRVAERAVLLVFLAASLAMGALFWSLATNDFSIAYVAQHSARTMPLHYRLGAAWGGQAGSLLLWGWMLTAYGAAAVLGNRTQNRALMPWVCVALLANVAFFLGLVNFESIPFERLPHDQRLSDGNGLNPLLQHPVMMIHPVMLYTGFTGFALPFAFAFAALVTGELGTTWFRTTRRWTLFAWSVLSVGIMLGGRWAYEVLGWGGYWAWDPVENASLMPWIAGTAYLHSVMIQEKRDMLKTWNLVLIGLTYGLCLFGTFLTRSGIVQSVHAFANSDSFGRIFASYVVLILVAYVVALIFRLPRLRSSNRLESVLSREASFIINNWIFMALLFVVFVGTMFPVFTEALSGARRILGPPYFNTFAGILALLLLVLTGIGPLIAWRRASLASLRRQFVLPAGVGLAVAAGVLVLFGTAPGYWAIACWGLGGFVLTTIAQEYGRAVGARMRRLDESAATALATLLRRNQRRYGGYIVHAGVVILLLGVSGAAFNEEKLENLRPGQSVSIQDFRLHYLTAEAIPAQHYGGAKARLALYRGGEDDPSGGGATASGTPLAVMTPEKRLYWLEQQPNSIPSIWSTWREDLYVILTAVEPDGSATFKIYHNPLVNWGWAGGVIFVLGCVLVLWPHPERGAATHVEAPVA